MREMLDITIMTAGEYQNQGASLRISYSTFDTKFGLCLVASTPKGITNIIFADADNAVNDLRGRWKKAKLVQKHVPEHEAIKKYFSDFTLNSEIKLHLYGTDFQIKVWEALLNIPHGQITSYGSIAQKIGNPRASQAIGGAVGDNPIAYIIPCHRVLRSDGEIGGYRWGVERKRAMLAYESQ